MIQRKILDNIEASEDLFLLGVVSLEKDELAYKRYLNWLKCGNHAGMTYGKPQKSSSRSFFAFTRCKIMSCLGL